MNYREFGKTGIKVSEVVFGGGIPGQTKRGLRESLERPRREPVRSQGSETDHLELLRPLYASDFGRRGGA
jgi:aryl-alcohol dehydrogenase-like predicted oxidoreductase